MSTDDKPVRDKAKDERGAFLAIGIVFIILGLSSFASDGNGGLTAFFAVGVVFLALSATSEQRHRTGAGDGAPVTDGTTPAGGPASDVQPPPGADGTPDEGTSPPRPAPEP